MQVNNPVVGARDKVTGLTYKRSMRIERAARLALDPAHYSIEQIASFCGLTVAGLSQIRRTQAYHNKIIELKTGLIAEDDRILRENLDVQRSIVKSMVPTALANLAELIHSKNEQIKLKAIGEVLDREGTHAKVSRTSISLEKVPDMSEANKIGAELAAMLRSGFDSTSAFTKTGEESQAEQEEQIKKATTINELDLSKLPVQ